MKQEVERREPSGGHESRVDGRYLARSLDWLSGLAGLRSPTPPLTGARFAARPRTWVCVHAFAAQVSGCLKGGTSETRNSVGRCAFVRLRVARPSQGQGKTRMHDDWKRAGRNVGMQHARCGLSRPGQRNECCGGRALHQASSDGPASEYRCAPSPEELSQ
jgi:hypothetical protein